MGSSVLEPPSLGSLDAYGFSAEFADPRLSATTRALTIETLTDEELADQVRDRLLRPQLNAVRTRLEAAREAGQVRTDAPWTRSWSCCSARSTTVGYCATAH